MRRWIPHVLALLLLSLASSSAQAQLVSRDLVPGSGDGLVTFDSATGLEWLDITETLGASFVEIADGGGGWYAAGWVHATGPQVCQLFGTYGVAPNPCPNPTPLPEVLGSNQGGVSSFLGQAFFLGLPIGLRGFYDDGNTGDELVGVGGYSIRQQRPVAFSTTAIQDNQAASFEPSPVVGNFLVRQATTNIEYCDVEINATSFTSGEVVTATVLSVGNPEASDRQLEWKVWLEQPSDAPIPIVNTGADGTLALFAGSSSDFGPVPIIGVDGSTPAGIWSLDCRVLDPTTGEELHLDENPFKVSP